MSGFSTEIDLSDLQRRVQPGFQAYDQAVAHRDCLGAITARSAICAKATQFINEHPILKQRGIYVFVDSKEPDDFRRLVYIGMTADQRGCDRLLNYLREDISVLDPNLLSLDLQPALFKIEQRLEIAMPGGSADARRRYVNGVHKKAMQMSKADTIMFSPLALDRPEMRSCETVLIATAHAMAGGICYLVNRQQLRWEKAKQHISEETSARTVVHQLNERGLGQNISDHWLSKIADLAMAAA